MKYLKVVLVISLLFIGNSVYSQEKTNKLFYSIEENEYIKEWLSKEVDSMKMTDNKKLVYYKILKKYTYKMTNLGGENEKYTDMDFKIKLSNIVDEMNLMMNEILTAKQYDIHINIFKIIQWNISIRK